MTDIRPGYCIERVLAGGERTPSTASGPKTGTSWPCSTTYSWFSGTWPSSPPLRLLPRHCAVKLTPQSPRQREGRHEQNQGVVWGLRIQCAAPDGGQGRPPLHLV